MAKNIVICSDGTGNTANKGRGTNVFKLYEAVDRQGHRRPGKTDLREQVAVYDDGVGTSGAMVLKLLGGAFGIGLASNVRQLYVELSRHYAEGDRIFLFGFSRGAFTVRTLAGLVSEFGLLDARDLDERALRRQAAAAYRELRRCKPALLERPFAMVRRLVARLLGWPDLDRSGLRPAPVRFMGVWDTVDAVGFPIVGVSRIWNRVIYRFKFPDQVLSHNVKTARHALAIDDQRGSFHPLLWDEDGKPPRRRWWDRPDEWLDRWRDLPPPPEPKAHPDIQQVWFAGVHSNVGGGYPKHGMSMVALDWMASCAESLSDGDGLRFDPEMRRTWRDNQSVDGTMYDPRRGAAVFYRLNPRPIELICERLHTPVRIHASAIGRAVRGTAGYAPGNLPECFECVADDGAPMRGEPTPGPARLQRRKGEGDGEREGEGEGKPDFSYWWRTMTLRKAIQIQFFAGLFVSAACAIYLSSEWAGSASGLIGGAHAAGSAMPVGLPESGVGYWIGVALSALFEWLPFSEVLERRIAVPIARTPALSLFTVAVPAVSWLASRWVRGHGERAATREWRKIEAVKA